jgi:YVTN family beta-propeller protein
MSKTINLTEKTAKAIFRISAASVLILLASLMVSCHKEPDPPAPQPQDTTLITHGIYILNEGLFNQNNATLTRFDFSDSTAVTDFFLYKNGRGLGDTGSDMGLYGAKLYIIVNVSSQVEVADATTGISLARIPLFDNQKARQPRKIAFYGRHAFVCNFDNTVAVIDTTSLQIIKYIEAGRNPDGILAAYGKIWVSNSGGLAFPDYDNTISVIDPESLTEERRINVGINPYTLRSDRHGNILVISRGNYSNVKSRLQIFEAESGNMIKTFEEFEALGMAVAGDSAWVYNYDWVSGKSSIKIINTSNLEIVNDSFLADGNKVNSIYGISVDEQAKLVYITDAGNFTGNGRVYAFDFSGKHIFDFPAGINPSAMVFLTQRVN